MPTACPAPCTSPLKDSPATSCCFSWINEGCALRPRRAVRAARRPRATCSRPWASRRHVHAAHYAFRWVPRRPKETLINSSRFSPPWSFNFAARRHLPSNWQTRTMKVLVAMSGGVDSSVAAGRLIEEGYDVVGATLKLWGGVSDSGCCSVADVDDARRVAQQLGIEHHVFNLTEEFDRHVVMPYVEAHAEGRTPNPCIECNRSIKFDRLLERSDRLGFDRLATGPPARVGRGRSFRLRRGADPDKDQSYVLSMLGQPELARVVFPVGEMTKPEVRSHAARLGLRTAGKPDSQDVCFIGSVEGRQGFLAD